MGTTGLLLVYVLAVARITGLITADELTRPLQDRILGRLDERKRSHSMFATLITCQWCVSMWVGIVTVVVWWLWAGSPWVLLPALALAASQVTGMLSHLGRD